jgi:uncharacterized Zn-binding protein involved in type VI secretion
MGKAAARMGDTANTCNDPSDMPVGTVIAVGTVLINKMPAAKQNDHIVGVDTHIIMIPTPGGPVPTPLPHPFAGMITGGCSATVKIMGMPAATVDSTADNMPPHIPQGGPFQKPPSNKAKIIMGSPNVFIDNGGGGGGGGASGGTKTDAKSGAKEVEEGHYLDVKFVDKGGKPIMGASYDVKGPSNEVMHGPLTGQVKKTGVKEGSHEIALRAITKVEWSETKAKVGDKLKLSAQLAGFESGITAEFLVYAKDTKSADRQIAGLTTETGTDKVEVDWVFKYGKGEGSPDLGRTKLNKYSRPSFYFIVDAGGIRQRSSLLQMADDLELELYDENGNPIKEEEYQVYSSDGKVSKGNLDKDGKATLKDVPAGKNRVVYPKLEGTKKIPR